LIGERASSSCRVTRVSSPRRRSPPDFLAEVDVRFIADDKGTLLELDHRNLDRFGAAA